MKENNKETSLLGIRSVTMGRV